MSILKLIASTSYLTVNKTLAKKLSLEAAILYADLASVQIYWLERGESWFFRTREQIEDDTTLSRSKQIKAYKILEQHGLIQSKFKGIPAKKYYNIDAECMQNLVDLLDDDEIPSCLKIERLEHQKLNGINKNKENKNISNNKLKEKSIKKEIEPEAKAKQQNSLKTPKPKKEKVAQKRKKGLDFNDITWPPVFEKNAILKNTFLEFAQMRKDCNKPYKTLKGIETKIRALAKDCQKFGVETVIGAIEFSTGSEYMGIFVQDYHNKKSKHEQQNHNQPTKGFYQAYYDAIYNNEPEAQNNTIDIDWDE